MCSALPVFYSHLEMLNRRYTCVLLQTHLWLCGCYKGQFIDYLLFPVRLLDSEMIVALMEIKSNESPLEEQQLKIQPVSFFFFPPCRHQPRQLLQNQPFSRWQWLRHGQLWVPAPWVLTFVLLNSLWWQTLYSHMEKQRNYHSSYPIIHRNNVLHLSHFKKRQRFNRIFRFLC